MRFLVMPQMRFSSACGKYCFVDCWRVGSCERKKAVM